MSRNAAAPHVLLKVLHSAVPGIGSTTGERRKSHASEITAVETFLAAAIFSTTLLAARPCAMISHGQRCRLLRNNRPRNPIRDRKTVAVLHATMVTIFCACWMCSSVTLEKSRHGESSPAPRVAREFPSRRQRRRPDRAREAGNLDAFHAKTLEAAFNGFLNVRGPRVVLPIAGAMARPSGFGGDEKTGRIRPGAFAISSSETSGP